MNRVNFMLTTKELNRGIETCIYNANHAKKEMHRLVVAGCMHAQLHGDTRPITRLITGLKEQGRHVRVNAMRKVIEHYTPMVFKLERKRGDKFIKDPHFEVNKTETAKPWDIDGLIKDPFYDSNKGIGGEGGAEWDIENLAKMVARQLKKHGKSISDLEVAIKKIA